MFQQLEENDKKLHQTMRKRHNTQVLGNFKYSEHEKDPIMWYVEKPVISIDRQVATSIERLIFTSHAQKHPFIDRGPHFFLLCIC